MHGPAADPRELALQVVDIVALRPEVELCYLGIGGKCFEILESRDGSLGRGGLAGESYLQYGGVDGVGAEGEEDEGEETESEDVEEDEDEDEDDEDEEEDDDDEESEFDAADRGEAARLRLREILFYDDKVAVFRARYGRL